MASDRPRGGDVAGPNTAGAAQHDTRNARAFPCLSRGRHHSGSGDQHYQRPRRTSPSACRFRPYDAAPDRLHKLGYHSRRIYQDAIETETRKKHEDWYRQAAASGTALNAGRQGKLQKKRHALTTRMKDREDDYLRFARDLRVPFSDNEAERAIRMSKLRIKVSGCVRSMAGAEEFCAVRSYLATAVRHGISSLHALTRAFQGRPWIPGTG